MSKKPIFLVVLLLNFFCINAYSADLSKSSDEGLVEIKVKAPRVANDLPAGSYATAATTLRFDPLTELQSRGLSEGQSDVTIRGGLFENTGFKIGAVTVMDPQTGHYVAELPVDPILMTTPNILVGIDSAIEGFNSAIATVSYGIRRVNDGGDISLGVGSDNLNFQSMKFGHVTIDSSGNDLGVAMSFARSEGDGSLPFGDHEFARANIQLQHASTTTQTDLILSYQDKFFGWPGAYTGFASYPEIDDTQTTLLLASHRRETRGGWFETSGFYRRLVDDYDFNRLDIESGIPGSFEHETKVVGIGFQGLYESSQISWRYGGQLTADKLVRSTDLTNGFFNNRTYATVSLVPTIKTDLQNGNKLIWRFGASFDYSNRDSNKVSPLLGLTLSNSDAAGTTNYSIEYAAASQVPGYTVLNSKTSGLFGGNPFLGREIAKQLSLSVERNSDDWRLRATLFNRHDDDLVDWTYATGAPFSRQANSVDIKVIGLETFVIKTWESIDLIIGYTALHKDADYGLAQVDASFYALNFAKHRATLSLAYRFAKAFELRIDNGYRIQEDNPLRTGDDSTFLSSASLNWLSPRNKRFGATLVVDNVTDSEYQPFPGTPASGRQVSLSARYTW
ncbi:MAG: TonB-dependent receptor [Woeseiaceae bacterium]|jgi:hypothetical protein|nr:TonB-dependent receptor [Woeseiaceae bacterium]